MAYLVELEVNGDEYREGIFMAPNLEILRLWYPLFLKSCRYHQLDDLHIYEVPDDYSSDLPALKYKEIDRNTVLS